MFIARSQIFGFLVTQKSVTMIHSTVSDVTMDASDNVLVERAGRATKCYLASELKNEKYPLEEENENARGAQHKKIM